MDYSLASLIHCRLAFRFVQSLLAATLEKHGQALNGIHDPFVLSHLQTGAREGDQSRHWDLGCAHMVMPPHILSDEHRTWKVNERLKTVLVCLDEAVFQPWELLCNGVLAPRSLHPP